MVRLLAATLALTICTALWADFDQGLSAYRAGDFERAFKEFHASATSGHPTAQFNVGVLYYRGEGVERNVIRAYGWIELATQHRGNEELLEAQEVLALMLTPEEIQAGLRDAERLARNHDLDYRPSRDDFERSQVVDSMR